MIWNDIVENKYCQYFTKRNVLRFYVNHSMSENVMYIYSLQFDQIEFSFQNCQTTSPVKIHNN